MLTQNKYADVGSEHSYYLNKLKKVRRTKRVTWKKAEKYLSVRIISRFDLIILQCDGEKSFDRAQEFIYFMQNLVEIVIKLIYMIKQIFIRLTAKTITAMKFFGYQLKNYNVLLFCAQ